jgi:S-DNA-T family DNA segregation ATPase FtsK/SpoIIIE
VDAAGYSDLVGDTRVDSDSNARLIPRRGIRGRGLVANPPREFQTALAEHDAELAGSMARAWSSSGGRQAEPIAVAPKELALAPLLSLDSTPGAALGVQLDSLQTLSIGLAEGPHFLVTGPHRGGKSTALQTWLLSLAASLDTDQLRLVLVDFGGSPGLSPLRALPNIVHVEDEDGMAAVIEEVGDQLSERRAARDRARRERGGLLDDLEFLRAYPSLVMAIDDVDQFESAAPRQASALEALVRQQRGLGLHVLLAGATGDIASAYAGITGVVKSAQTGLLVGGGDDAGLLNLRLPRAESERALPPGRGYYVRKGYPPRPVQLASAHFGDMPFMDFLDSIRRRDER